MKRTRNTQELNVILTKGIAFVYNTLDVEVSSSEFIKRKASTQKPFSDK